MSARDIHADSLQKREEGNFEEALKLNATALIMYQEEKDSAGFAEALADQTITLRLLYQKTNTEDYLILAKHQLEATIEISEVNKKEESLPLAYFNLGKVNVELKDFHAAVKAYKKAVEHQLKSPSHNHNRPAVMADFIIHLSVAEYKDGDKTAKTRLIEALTQLEASDEPSYNKLVWTSGAYMYLADMLREDEPENAKMYLEKAKKIVDSDDRLVLRREQWQKLAKEFN